MRKSAGVRGSMVGMLLTLGILLCSSLPVHASAPPLKLKPAYGAGCTGATPTGVTVFTSLGSYVLPTPKLSNGKVDYSHTSSSSGNRLHPGGVAAQQYFIVGCYEHNSTNQAIVFWANWSITYNASLTAGCSSSNAAVELQIVAAVHAPQPPYYIPSDRPTNTVLSHGISCGSWSQSTTTQSESIRVSATVTHDINYDFYTSINDTSVAVYGGGTIAGAQLGWNATLNTVQCVCP